MAFSSLNTPTTLSPDDADEIRSTAKWARLVAIVGFILLGLMLLIGVLYGLMLHRMAAFQGLALGGAAMPFDADLYALGLTAAMLIAVVIYFFPTLFLYRYATRTLRALGGSFDAAAFSTALRAHRSFYGYAAVLCIVMALCYVILLAIVAIAMAMAPTA